MAVSDSDLYDTDILLWSERQADLLRHRAAGERANDASIDWPNIAEEIEDVGRSELHSVESLLVQALRHMLKAEAWPLHRDAENWCAEAIDFRQQAQRRFSESMCQIDMERLYRHARRALPQTMDGLPPLPFQPRCRLSTNCRPSRKASRGPSRIKRTIWRTERDHQLSSPRKR